MFFVKFIEFKDQLLGSANGKGRYHHGASSANSLQHNVQKGFYAGCIGWMISISVSSLHDDIIRLFYNGWIPENGPVDHAQITGKDDFGLSITFANPQLGYGGSQYVTGIIEHDAGWTNSNVLQASSYV